VRPARARRALRIEKRSAALDVPGVLGVGLYSGIIGIFTPPRRAASIASG
jgi:hypothetical protein